MPFDNYFTSDVDIQIYFSLKTTAMKELFGEYCQEDFKETLVEDNCQ